MWVYYEETDGELQPKWLILKARTKENCPYYRVDVPFQRFYPEDAHDEFHALTITGGDLVRNPLEYSSFGIAVHRLKDTADLDNINFFILLCDDLQEILALDLQRRFRTAGNKAASGKTAGHFQ
ncbi:hypothetical protein SAMN05421736_11570 [Evansella caseinilytica]|uniref:Uncharacterized protein n=1 Tax=Evansella caseinilytica TaxID=1503961 RepID=A0A1H3TMP3_9BACI|nr:hypothetical protein [Evansella caseinilytica]SDZ51081.1 hypothetical protein SAMN05421736_11570 [Evansella caseinilytica]